MSLELPAELRHQILLECLPKEIIVGSGNASPVRDLKLVCHQFNEDLHNLSTSYHATYILTHPDCMKYIRQKNGIDEIKHIRLHAWFLTKLNLTRDNSHVVPGVMAPHDTLSPWIDALAVSECKLPKRGLQTIELDINPAPEETRQRSRAWKTWLVNDSHMIDRTCINRAVNIADIIEKLVVWMRVTAHNQQPRLLVTSSLTKKSQLRIPEVFEKISEAQQVGLDVRFESDSLEDAHQVATLETVDEILQSTCDSDPQRYRSGKPLHTLRAAFESDHLARHLFYRSATEHPQRTVQVVLYFFEYARSWNGRHRTIRRLTARQRALLIHVAELMGMTCELEDEYCTERGHEVADLHVGFRARPDKSGSARDNDSEAVKEKVRALEELMGTDHTGQE